MNRRSFIKRLGVPAVVAVAAPIVAVKAIENVVAQPHQLTMDEVLTAQKALRKDVLCVSVDCIPDGVTAQEFLDLWHQTGSIVYRPSHGQKPHWIEAKDLIIKQ